MRRVLFLVGFALIAAFVVGAYFVKEAREDDQLACSIEQFGNPGMSGCDVQSWWPVIAIGVAAAVVLFAASKVQGVTKNL